MVNFCNGAPYRAAYREQTLIAASQFEPLPTESSSFFLSFSRCQTCIKVCLPLLLFILHRCYPIINLFLFKLYLGICFPENLNDTMTYPMLQFQGLLKCSYHVLLSLPGTVTGHLTKLQTGFCTTKKCRLESLLRL